MAAEGIIEERAICPFLNWIIHVTRRLDAAGAGDALARDDGRPVAEDANGWNAATHWISARASIPCETELRCRSDDVQDSEIKQCFQEYNLQDKVDALKHYLGIRDSIHRISDKDYSDKNRCKKFNAVGVKECLQPSVPSTFQVLVSELRDTVRSSYWNKEIGKTIYLAPHLPAGCDPLETTFGKATIQDGHGVAEILKPRDDLSASAEESVHALYRRSHNDYNPSEQVDRKYQPPFDKRSSFDGKKRTDFSGKKAAKCLQWFNPEAMTLVSRRLAEYYDRSIPRVGKVRNREIARALSDLTFGKNANRDVVSIADTLNESSDFQQGCDNYCSEYAERISKSCESSRGEIIAAAELPNERTKPLRAVAPTGALRCDEENLGHETSAQALISPNIFTQFGLSHVDFFKARDRNEIRSIFENIGIRFPGNSFDDLWKEGLAKDCVGGVCVETFRNLLSKLPLKNCNDESA